MTRVNIELEEELHRKAKIACAMQSTTLIEFIIKSLEEKVKKEKIK